MPPVLRNLSASELTGPEVRELLRLATDFDDGALDRLVSEVLPRLTVLAAMDDDAGRTPIALAAYAPPGGQAVREPEAGPQEPRPSPSTTIEYIATSPTHQRTGTARALIAEIRRRHPRAVLRASTDDDAIGFYRALGFLDHPAPRDPRWPERRCYDCVLDVLDAL